MSTQSPKKMNLELSIAIRIGSPHSTLELVKQTIESFQECLPTTNYKFVLSTDPQIPRNIKDYIQYKSLEKPLLFLLLPEERVYWSEFVNEAIRKSEDAEYFLIAHDDIQMLTPDFLSLVKKALGKFEHSCGWIAFDDVGYLNSHWSTPSRPGYFVDFMNEDAWSKRSMFQFHNLPPQWWKGKRWKADFYFFQYQLIRKLKLPFTPLSYPVFPMGEELRNLLDIPQKPVKCHAPFNQCSLIKTSTLKEIGFCENWETFHGLLVDEDWGLRALEKQKPNIWLPSIQYLHVRKDVPGGGDRAQEQITVDQERVHNLFKTKWGFDSVPSKDGLEEVKKNFGSTLIPWSVNRRSYEGDYIE